MKIINQTKNIILATKVVEADRFWLRLQGLLFQPLWKNYQGLYLKSCKSIHTFGLKNPIDIIYVNHVGCIIKWQTIRPYRISVGPKLTQGVVELPQGTCRSTKCDINDQLIQVMGKGW